MTHENEYPNNLPGHDALASRLAQLIPTSASSLQAQAFYQAGMDAAQSERHSARAGSWRTISIFACMLISSCGLSYYAGLKRNEQTMHIVKAPEAQAEARVAVETPESVHESDQSITSSLVKNSTNKQQPDNSGLKLSFARWLTLPSITPEEYARRLETQTSPWQSHAATDANSTGQGSAGQGTSDAFDQAWLRELRDIQRPARTGRWFSL